MGRIRDAIGSLVGSKKAAPMELDLLDREKWVSILGGSSWAGINVTDASVLQMTTSWRCIRLISETIGTLPLVLYKKTPGGTEPATDHELYFLLHDQPHPHMTSIEWVESMAVSLCVYGQAYNHVTRIGGRVRAIRPVPKSSVSPRVVDGDVIYTVTEGGQQRELKRADICPIRGFGAAGSLEGLPPYKLQTNSLALSLAAEKYGAEFFGGGGRPSAIFTGEKWPDAENVKKFQELFANSANQTVFTGGGYTYQPITGDNSASQFIETREFQVRETANIWGVPADRVLSKGGDTYNNTEQRNLQFLQTTLLPYLRRIEQGLESSLLSKKERADYQIRFNFEGLLRGDSRSRAEFYRTMRNIAGMTVNEMRQLERLPRVEGGDDLHMPLNMAPLDQIREINGDSNADD